MESAIETNEGNLFCVVGYALNRLKPEDYRVEPDGSLLVLDKATGRIAEELSKMYIVEEVI